MVQQVVGDYDCCAKVYGFDLTEENVNLYSFCKLQNLGKVQLQYTSAPCAADCQPFHHDDKSQTTYKKKSKFIYFTTLSHLTPVRRRFHDAPSSYHVYVYTPLDFNPQVPSPATHKEFCNKKKIFTYFFNRLFPSRTIPSMHTRSAR